MAFLTTEVRTHRLLIKIFLAAGLVWINVVIIRSLGWFVIDFFSDGKQASVFCHNPHYGYELTTPSKLPGMGLPGASDGRIEQLIHPDIKNEFHYILHLLCFHILQRNGKSSCIRDETSAIIIRIHEALGLLFGVQDLGKFPLSCCTAGFSSFLIFLVIIFLFQSLDGTSHSLRREGSGTMCGAT